MSCQSPPCGSTDKWSLPLASLRVEVARKRCDFFIMHWFSRRDKLRARPEKPGLIWAYSRSLFVDDTTADSDLVIGWKDSMRTLPQGKEGVRPRVSITQRLQPKNWKLTLSVLVFAVLALSGCGARIDTSMTVAHDGSGSRVMNLTLSASNVQYVNGGAEAINASVNKRLPPQIAYSGAMQDANGITAIFTITFTSPADYTAKVKAILGAGSEDDVRFVIVESPLVNGTSLQEYYSSATLLKWMFDGLVEDGVISQGNASSAYELGTTTLSVDGKSTSQSSYIRYDNLVDNRFHSVRMQTIVDEQTYTRTITLEPPFSTNKFDYKKFLTDNAPPGSEVSTVSGSEWTVRFTGDENQIATATRAVFLAKKTQFSVTDRVPPDDPTRVIRTITDTVDCRYLCSYQNPTVTDTVLFGPHHSTSELTVDTSLDKSYEVSYLPPVESVDINLKFGFFGDVTATVDIAVLNREVDRVPDGFDQLFRPDPLIGTLTSTRGDQATTFTVVIKGKDFDSFVTAYQSWVPGSRMWVDQLSASGLLSKDQGYVIDPGLSSIVHGHGVSNHVKMIVSLPVGYSVEGQEALKLSGVAVEGNWTGHTLTTTSSSGVIQFRVETANAVGIAILGIILAAVVAGIALGVIHRRRWMPWVRAKADRVNHLETASLFDERGEEPVNNKYQGPSLPLVSTVAPPLSATGHSSNMTDWASTVSTTVPIGVLLARPAEMVTTDVRPGLTSWPPVASQWPSTPVPSLHEWGSPMEDESA